MPAENTTRHALRPGQMLTLALREGSTLICHGPAIQLSTTPLSTLNACTSHHLRLSCGQSWRAPVNLWVQILCIQEPSCIHVEQPAPLEKENRPSLARLGRWIWNHIPRGLNAGIKREQRAI